MGVGQRNPVTILLVDDMPAKLLSYEVILDELGERLIKANSARAAFEALLKNDIAVILVDVCMPDLDGFELVSMVREHPRFQETAIIFISAIQVSDFDHIRGYEAGAVDYVPVPVMPGVLRAKVRVFCELYRKTKALERLNAELESRVAERTAALEASAQRLQESEQRRSLALAAGRMGCWDWNLETHEFIGDDGQHEIFGVRPESFAASPENVKALVHPDDLPDVREAAMRAIAIRTSFSVEFRVVRPDGQTRWCVAAASPSFDAYGKAIRITGVTSDITERKIAEEAIRSLNEELEQRVQDRTRERETALAQLFEAQKIDTIGQLTGGVAHDFNNLLMAILGSLELLKKRLQPDDARALRLLENAVQGGERGAALTQRLLTFARRQELKPQSIDIAALIGGVENFLERAVGPEIRISKSLPADLAPVQVDANQLELALLNLCVNARDAMPLGGGSLSIAAANAAVLPGTGLSAPGLQPGDYVKISVSDTGAGMDSETLAKAAEPFFTTKGVGKGTGLGLSMVHGLAGQSGGALRISSEVGRGTTVELWLPRASGGPEGGGLPFSPDAEAATDITLAEERPLNVLLVDDDRLVSAGTSEMLEDLGHSVVQAESAAQALQVLEAEHASTDLVISDYAMPGMTGLELGKMIRETYPGVPIILATGYAELLANKPEPSFPRLSKPFRQAELATMIRSVVDPTSFKASNVVSLRSGLK